MSIIVPNCCLTSPSLPPIVGNIRAKSLTSALWPTARELLVDMII